MAMRLMSRSIRPLGGGGSRSRTLGGFGRSGVETLDTLGVCDDWVSASWGIATLGCSSLDARWPVYRSRTRGRPRRSSATRPARLTTPSLRLLRSSSDTSSSQLTCLRIGRLPPRTLIPDHPDCGGQQRVNRFRLRLWLKTGHGNNLGRAWDGSLARVSTCNKGCLFGAHPRALWGNQGCGREASMPRVGQSGMGTTKLRVTTELRR
jgi:hypothetical protein